MKILEALVTRILYDIFIDLGNRAILTSDSESSEKISAVSSEITQIRWIFVHFSNFWVLMAQTYEMSWVLSGTC